jgi:gentisate 1,2-dioxygenase
VLILEKPGLPGQSKITGSLSGGLQLLMPGERAHAHRCTGSALRLFLEGTGTYTAVDSERTIMQRSDFVLTLAWTWHEYGNEGLRASAHRRRRDADTERGRPIDSART